MTRHYHSDRRSAAADATRDAILAAFADQLGRPGATDVSVPVAAAAAGVSVRTVYHHFPDERARREALATWVEHQLTGRASLPELRTADDLAALTTALYTSAADAETLLRAQAAAGFAMPVRLERLTARRNRIAEVLADLGAPAEPTRRATAVIMVLMSAEAGLPLIDVHGLTFNEAGHAAAQAVAAIVADLRARADVAHAKDSKPRSPTGRRATRRTR